MKRTDELLKTIPPDLVRILRMDQEITIEYIPPPSYTRSRKRDRTGISASVALPELAGKRFTLEGHNALLARLAQMIDPSSEVIPYTQDEEYLSIGGVQARYGFDDKDANNDNHAVYQTFNIKLFPYEETFEQIDYGRMAFLQESGGRSPNRYIYFGKIHLDDFLRTERVHFKNTRNTRE